MSRFIKYRHEMTKNAMKIIEMQIRQALPDTLSCTQKCRLLEKMADEYRERSRKEVSEEVARFKAKK